MTLNLHYAGKPEAWDDYRRELGRACAEQGLSVSVSQEHPAEMVDYIIYAPNGPLCDFTPFTRAKAVLNLWAGVEKVVGNTTLKIPLTRMVDQGLSEGMVEWVVGHVMRHHLGMDQHILYQNGQWAPKAPPLARDRTIGLLGIGALGAACATALAGLNFNVMGWSRSEKSLPGITTLNGPTGMDQLLAVSDIVVTLLPNTPATANLINPQRIDIMKPGAILINPGRGELIDDDALLAALDTGQIGHATLDVFRTEPLPATHRFWTHPRVTVTPHIAAETRASTAAEVIAENIHRNENGQPMLYLVDRDLGY